MTLQHAPLLALAALALACQQHSPGEAEAPRMLTAAELRPTKTPRATLPGDGLPPKQPDTWFFAERAYPLDAIPLERWRAARAQAATPIGFAGVQPTWTSRGPTNIGGRITDLAVHPNNGDIVYAAAAEGGVLRSVDAGQNWTPLFDDQPSLSVGAIAIDPNDPQVIYAGTGEVNPGGGSVAYGGSGLYRSSDGGNSWTNLGLPNSGSIGRIRVDPSDSSRIFVAVMGYLWQDNPERGVYRSTDTGATWQKVLFVDGKTGCVDLIQRPDTPNVLLAAMWQRERRPEAYDYGGVGCAVYRSTDGGNTWSLVTNGLPAPSANGGRIGLSLCAAQPDVMYAVYADRIGFFDGAYRSLDGGLSWTQTNDAALIAVFASFGWWFGNIRAHPLDPDQVFVLGLDFYGSSNGGASWSNYGVSMHVDHHALEFGPGGNPELYAGNDGGVYRSLNGGTAWSKLPDLPITQVYRVALDANQPDTLLIGTQDNGTNRTTSTALDAWSALFGGDGFQALVHPFTSNRLWVQFQFGNVLYSNNGGVSWFTSTVNVAAGDRRNWNSPLIQDPTNVDTRYFGTNKVYRSVTSVTWTAISPDLTGGPHAGNTGQVNGTLTSLAVSPQDADVIWAGSDDGFVQVTTDGGSIWTDTSSALPDRWITSVRADPNLRETAYVTISGFRWTENMPRVYRSDDLGATWTPIAGNLPDAPANDFVADPADAARYFVATDLGVYESVDAGSSWCRLGAGLPNVVVTSLAFDSATRKLVAGTYGRGAFSLSLPTTPPGSGFCFGDPGSGTPCPCSNDNDGSVPGSGCDNGSFSSGAQLVASGVASVSNDSVVFSGSHLEPGNSGLYFQANNVLNGGAGLSFGDGLRCAGGSVVRLQIGAADGSGDSSTTVSIAAAGSVAPGDVRRYQCWYRTTSNPPCGVGVNDFNLTNGYEISWMP